MDTLSVAGDVVTAGTALAALVLLYIGALVAAWSFSHGSAMAVLIGVLALQ
jgi:hypothetical protein